MCQIIHAELRSGGLVGGLVGEESLQKRAGGVMTCIPYALQGFLVLFFLGG